MSDKKKSHKVRASSRLDHWLVAQKLCKNLHEATGYILGGKVLVNDAVQDKCGAQINSADVVRIKKTRRFASRAAEKIFPFLQVHNSFVVYDKIFLDIGASTGGFTSLLLEQGAKEVIALDVGYALLDLRLRQDARVHVLERVHICQLNRDMLPIIPQAFVMDISFISLRRVMPCLLKLFSVWQGLVLLKPQFELEFCGLYNEEKNNKELFSRGVICAPWLRKKIIDEFRDFLLQEAGLETASKIEIIAEDDAAIVGNKGNLEYIFWLRWQPT